MRLWLLLLFACAAFGADLGADLRAAARKGQTAQVDALLKSGAPIDSTDKDGRTALMLAASHGHVAVVRLLLDRGANPNARDAQGWTPYALAFAAGREDVMKLLPAPPPLAVFLDPTLDRTNLYSSCFMSPAQLAEHITALAPQVMLAAAIREFARSNGQGRVEFTDAERSSATLHLNTRPSASCMPQQSVDNLSLAIDVRFERAADHAALLVKTFGGGVKGMHARMLSSPAQYQPLLAGWAASHAAEIYLASVEAWLRAR